MPVAWIERQFKAMGRRDARDLAFALLASYEGIALLANTFRDPELMVREGRHLDRWIDSLSRDSKAVPPAGSSLARGQPARARSLTGRLSTEGV